MTPFYMEQVIRYGGRNELGQPTGLGPCPIEAGVIGKLSDHECEHGRLPGDQSAPCGCWPGEAL